MKNVGSNSLSVSANPSHFKGATHPVDNVSWCDAVLFCNRLSITDELEPAYIIPEGFEQVCKQQTETWDDNVNELSKQVRWNRDANGYRLPTEAEWEYCARGGEEHLYSGSDNIDEIAWYSDNSDGKTHAVGQKKGNGYGLYDMSGNVWELVWDTWDEKPYERGDVTDPCIEKSSHDRVYRGGSCYKDAGIARASSRSWGDASYRGYGFRILRMP